MTTTTTMAIARERQLDWLLGEVFGTAPPSHALRMASGSRSWWAAALIVLGAGVAIGTAVVRQVDDGGVGARGIAPVAPTPQDAADIPWIEIHGEGGLATTPTDATALRCFDFTDADLERLGRFPQLTHLDLGAMDVDARGVATALKITDEGVGHLATLQALRWLSLAQCHDVRGETLAELRAIPLLEHLDLTYTGITSAGIAQLTQLPSLRELSLSHCMGFHGRSLAEVARLPGLRRLELAGCPTISAADVQQLAALPGLRHLDLRDCMGAFRGQVAVFLDDVTNGLPPAQPERPTQDSVGVTDAAIAALNGLPLETLRLDGCRSLTDGVAASLAKWPNLRAVGLGELPHITTKVLAALPAGLVELSLAGNRHLRGLGGAVGRFSRLEVLSLNGLEQLTDDDLANATAGKPLRVLRLGGTPRMSDSTGPEGAYRPKPTPAAVAKVLLELPSLEVLEASSSDWFDAEVAAAVAALPRLRELDLQSSVLTRAAFTALGSSRSLRDLRLVWARGVDVPALDALGDVPLRNLDLYGCPDLKTKDLGVFESWPDIRVRLPGGTRPSAPLPPRPARPR